MRNRSLAVGLLLLASLSMVAPILSARLSSIKPVCAQKYAFEIWANPDSLTINSYVDIMGKIVPNPSPDPGTGVGSYTYVTKPDGSQIRPLFSGHNLQDYSAGFAVERLKPDMVGLWVVYSVASWRSGGASNQVQSNYLRFLVSDEGFTVSTSRTEIGIYQGSSGRMTADVSSPSRRSYTVALTLTGHPSRVTYSFDPQSMNPPFSSTLMLTVAKEIPVGRYTITITGTGGGYTASATFTLLVLSSDEQWVGFTPPPDWVDISVDASNPSRDVPVTVKITFPTAGYRVPDWGTITATGNVFTSNAVVEKWTGAHAQVVTVLSKTYSLGPLKDGQYRFDFYANRNMVKAIEFTVQKGEPGSLSHFDLNYLGRGEWENPDGNDEHSVKVGPDTTLTMYFSYKESNAGNRYIIRVYGEWDETRVMAASTCGGALDEVGSESGGGRWDMRRYTVPSRLGTYKIRVVYRGSSTPPTWNSYDRLLGEYTVTVAIDEQWVKFTPPSDWVDISVDTSNPSKDVSVTVKIVFPTRGYRVLDWGTVQPVRHFASNAIIEKWTGTSAQEVTVVSNTYGLGALSEGQYHFDFNVNGNMVKTKEFTVTITDSYSVTFQQSGIPLGIAWGVTVGSNHYTSAESSLIVSGLSGTADYSYDKEVQVLEGTRYMCSSGGSGTFSASTIVTAVYHKQYRLKITVNDSTMGTTYPAPGAYWYRSGTYASPSPDALPQQDCKLNYWTLDGKDAGSTSPIQIVMDQPHYLVANFQRISSGAFFDIRFQSMKEKYHVGEKAEVMMIVKKLSGNDVTNLDILVGTEATQEAGSTTAQIDSLSKEEKSVTVGLAVGYLHDLDTTRTASNRDGHDRIRILRIAWTEEGKRKSWREGDGNQPFDRHDVELKTYVDYALGEISYGEQKFPASGIQLGKDDSISIALFYSSVLARGFIPKLEVGWFTEWEVTAYSDGLKIYTESHGTTTFNELQFSPVELSKRTPRQAGQLYVQVVVLITRCVNARLNLLWYLGLAKEQMFLKDINKS